MFDEAMISVLLCLLQNLTYYSLHILSSTHEHLEAPPIPQLSPYLLVESM
jgi:hypothetical protein